MSDCKARVVLYDETSNKRGEMVFALLEKSSVDRTKRAKNNLQDKVTRADNAS